MSDTLSNSVLELLDQCDFFDRDTDVDRLWSVDSSLVAIDFSLNAILKSRQSVFVGSSRLPQKLDQIPELFDGLLKLAVGLDSDKDVLLTARGTACDAMVRRIGELFQIPVIELRIAPTEPKQLNAEVSRLGGGDSNVVFVFDVENRGIDFALANLAIETTVLSLRKDGNLHTAIKQRLIDGKLTRVLVDKKLTKKKLTEELLSCGATGWVLYGARDSESGEDQTARDLRYANDFDSSGFLLHWTRRRVGPWPEQTDADFLDDLIFRSAMKDHCEVASLRRILATEQIIASSDLTRDPRPVVCFSEVTFEELKKLRTFRSHLSRWDFEPYGIAFRKSWLVDQGAAAVIYGDQSVWENLKDSERAFFQLNDPNGKVDWSVEREWRILGDLDLRKVPLDAAVVFVHTVEDSKKVAAFCRWPIVVLTAVQE